MYNKDMFKHLFFIETKVRSCADATLTPNFFNIVFTLLIFIQPDCCGVVGCLFKLGVFDYGLAEFKLFNFCFICVINSSLGFVTTGCVTSN